MALGLLGAPALNGFSGASVIVAGVIWSLAYEALFYAWLPLLRVTVPHAGRVPRILLSSSVVAIACFTLLHLAPVRLLGFLGGIAAAVLVRSQLVSRLARTPAAGLVAIGCTVAAVGLFPTSYAAVPTGLLAIAFSIIAGGNTLFGVLTARVSRMLGEISYGIYLLHGIILFVAFHLSIPHAESLSGTAHCLVGVLCTPVLVASAYFLFTCVERPWIEWAHQRVPRFPRQDAATARA
jgi:peptidoglycan/LPS O-acetylase OafA/YrhL